MRRAWLVILIVASAASLPTPVPAAVEVEPVTFTVTNPLEPGSSYEVNGHLYRPGSTPTCSTSVMLLQHGLSYGEWGWDFPLQTKTYSVARALARAGYPVVAIDRLGYGSSPHANGYLLTIEGYADITDQIIGHLRTGSYGAATPTAFDAVGLMGHSAGTEISEVTTAVYRSADLLIATAYHQFPSDRIVVDFFTGDYVRAAQSDYEYFGGDEAGRTEYMYNADFADPAIIARDHELANLTPSGEIYSIGPQPSRYVIATIDVPVLLVLAEDDLLFPVEYADLAAGMFLGSDDVTTHVVPTAGHSFMLHPNAPETNEVLVRWLEDRMAAC